MASSRGGGGGGAVRVGEMEKMNIDQLKALKEQTDLEVNLLQDSLNNIRTATGRLELASSALHDLSLRPQGLLSLSLLIYPALSDMFCVLKTSGKKMLVPLTASLYVPGSLDDAEKVLVDIGTGYFVEVTYFLL